jgi:hypothetical protein
VVALTADSAILTAWSNDIGFDDVFARQVQALGQPGDILLGISTSGRSRNVLQAFEAAHHKHMTCIALVGGDGGEAAREADLNLIIPAQNVARIQEVHILVLHLICELVEEQWASGRWLTALPVTRSFGWPGATTQATPVAVEPELVTAALKAPTRSGRLNS